MLPKKEVEAVGLVIWGCACCGCCCCCCWVLPNSELAGAGVDCLLPKSDVVGAGVGFLSPNENVEGAGVGFLSPKEKEDWPAVVLLLPNNVDCGAVACGCCVVDPNAGALAPFDVDPNLNMFMRQKRIWLNLGFFGISFYIKKSHLLILEKRFRNIVGYEHYMTDND